MHLNHTKEAVHLSKHRPLFDKKDESNDVGYKTGKINAEILQRLRIHH